MLVSLCICVCQPGLLMHFIVTAWFDIAAVDVEAVFFGCLINIHHW